MSKKPKFKVGQMISVLPKNHVLWHGILGGSFWAGRTGLKFTHISRDAHGPIVNFVDKNNISGGVYLEHVDGICLEPTRPNSPKVKVGTGIEINNRIYKVITMDENHCLLHLHRFGRKPKALKLTR